MPSTLFVHGGEEFARRVFRDESRGYWSAAFPLVLEKHGYLDFDVAGPEALARPETWARYPVVVVARVPESAWTPEAVEHLRGGPETLVEGPLPRALAQELGLRSQPADPEGHVVLADPALAEAAQSHGWGSGTRLGTATSRPIERAAELEWSSVGAPITEQQATAWRAAGWEAEWWEAPGDVEVIAEWVDAGASSRRGPAIVRRGNLTCCAFGLLAFLGQCHTVPPTEGPEFISWPRSLGLEALVLALIDQMHQRAGCSRLRLLPWPLDSTWVLNVRHDVDRPMSPAAADNILRRHRAAGTAATFYWRASHLGPRRTVRRTVSKALRRRPLAGSSGERTLRALARSPDHEIAHHTEQLWPNGAADQRRIELVSRRAVLGSSSHGDPQCFRWQGAPNLLWAAARNHLYTEFISHGHLHPHRSAALGRDGEISDLSVICLPHHASFDASTTPGDTRADSVRASADQHAERHGMLQVLNHPDINLDELFSVLATLPSDGRLDWTAAQAADWWWRSHTRSNLRFARAGAGVVEITAQKALFGAMLEIAEPDGRVSTVGLALESGRRAFVRGLSDSRPTGRSPLSKALT